MEIKFPQVLQVDSYEWTGTMTYRPYSFQHRIHLLQLLPIVPSVWQPSSPTTTDCRPIDYDRFNYNYFILLEIVINGPLHDMRLIY